MVLLKIKEKTPMIIPTPTTVENSNFQKYIQEIEDLESQLKSFFQESKKLTVNRRWIELSNVKVYVRKAVHSIEGKNVTTLDIANVILESEKDLTLLSAIFERIHHINPWDYTYVENIDTSSVGDKIVKILWDFDWTVKDDITRCFYKRKNVGIYEDAWTRSRNLEC
jgi:Cft2 family RNA processing exonuclease